MTFVMKVKYLELNIHTWTIFASTKPSDPRIVSEPFEGITVQLTADNFFSVFFLMARVGGCKVTTRFCHFPKLLKISLQPLTASEAERGDCESFKYVHAL